MQIDIPPEFRKACRNLGQDIAPKVRAMTAPEANLFLVQTAIIGVDRTEAEVIRRFIRESLSKGLTPEQLTEFWWKTPAEIYFYDGEQVARFLGSLGDRLAQPPFMD